MGAIGLLKYLPLMTRTQQKSVQTTVQNVVAGQHSVS